MTLSRDGAGMIQHWLAESKLDRTEFQKIKH